MTRAGIRVGVFCDELVQQELDNTNAYIEIPRKSAASTNNVPSLPLVRAYCLEEKLKTPQNLLQVRGQHTLRLPQAEPANRAAYYARKQGLKGVTTEPARRQWGTVSQHGLRLSGS